MLYSPYAAGLGVPRPLESRLPVHAFDQDSRGIL